MFLLKAMLKQLTVYHSLVTYKIYYTVTTARVTGNVCSQSMKKVEIGEKMKNQQNVFNYGSEPPQVTKRALVLQ